MPRCELLCIDSPSPHVSAMPASSCERRRPPQRWWSDSTICTASDGDRRRRGARRRSRTCWWPAGRRPRADRGHAGDARRRVLEVLDDPLQPIRHLERGRRASTRRWDRAAAAGRGTPSRSASIASHSCVGRQHAALELERAEPPAVDHPACLGRRAARESAPRPRRRRGGRGGRPTCRRGSR